MTDQEKGTVTIVVDGQPVVMIDQSGLYVMDDIAYGGTLTDTGSGWIKSRIEKTHVTGDAAKTQEPTTPEPTRIEVDVKNHQINFFVGGQFMAVLKDDGFHVRDNLNYGGTLTDTGKSHFKTLRQNQNDNAEGGVE